MTPLLAFALPQGFNSLDLLTLALRLAFILLVYLFLYQVARVSVRELVTLGRVTSQAPAATSLFPNPAAALEVFDPAEGSMPIGTRLPLDAYSTIGRTDQNSLEFDDGFVSGSHAEIVFDQGRWWLQDLNSTNGTFLNDQPVHGRAALSDGDFIQFGRVQVRAHL